MSNNHYTKRRPQTQPVADVAVRFITIGVVLAIAALLAYPWYLIIDATVTMLRAP